MAKAFEFKQAERVRDTFKKHRVRYFFIGKSGGIFHLHGNDALSFPDFLFVILTTLFEAKKKQIASKTGKPFLA